MPEFLDRNLGFHTMTPDYRESLACEFYRDRERVRSTLGEMFRERDELWFEAYPDIEEASWSMAAADLRLFLEEAKKEYRPRKTLVDIVYVGFPLLSDSTKPARVEKNLWRRVERPNENFENELDITGPHQGQFVDLDLRTTTDSAADRLAVCELYRLDVGPLAEVFALSKSVPWINVHAAAASPWVVLVNDLLFFLDQAEEDVRAVD